MLSKTILLLASGLIYLVGGAVDEPSEVAKAAQTDTYGDPLPEGAIARVGTTRLRGYANIIAFSHDGRRLAYGDEKSFVRVCDTADGKLLFELQPVLRKPVTELAFSPDDTTLAVSGYWSGEIWLIDLATQKIRHTIPNTVADHNKWARLWQGPAFHFTPDGQTLIVGGKDGALHLWDTATGTEKATLPAVKERLVSVTLTADCGTALTAHSIGGVLHLWDVSKRAHLRKLAVSAKYPHFTALAPDGKTIAVAVGTDELELWEPDGAKQHQLKLSAAVAGLAYTPDAAALRVADANGGITIWDVGSGKKQNSIMCDGVQVFQGTRPSPTADRMGPKPAAWFGPDGKLMVWSDRGVLRPWDLTTGRESPKFTVYRGGIAWVGFAADGRQLHVGGTRGELAVWDPSTGRAHVGARATTLKGVTRYLPSADRRKVVAVTRGEDGEPKAGEPSIFLCDPAGDAAPVPLREQAGPAWYARLTPDNRFVVATEVAGRIRVYDAATGKAIRSFDGRKYEYWPTFSPDGKILATAGGDGSIRLYDFAKGRLLRELRGVSPAHSLAFSPDGRWLASGHSTSPLQEKGGDLIYLWETASGRELCQFPTGHGGVQSLSFSPDGRLIASCGYDQGVRLWEAVSGQQRRRYGGHQNWVNSVDFDPEGRRLASGSNDGTAVVWRIFEPAPAQRSAATLDALWADLAEDATVAHRAMAELIAAKDTPAFLKTRLKPAVLPPDKHVKALLLDLNSPVFKVRDAASKELARMGELIEGSLSSALAAAKEEELRRRLAILLDGIPRIETNPDRLRDLRAIEVLGHLTADEAHGVLEPLTKGAPDANLTRQAKVSLARLQRGR